MSNYKQSQLKSVHQLSAKCEYDSYGDSDECVMDDSMTALILNIVDIDENTTFQNNGYKKVNKMCNTLQGELYKAVKINESKQTHVAIKKTSKLLFQQRIAIEDGSNFCVSENIIKEALILKHLTVDNQPIGDYIVKYIDFFETQTDYYLVMEYIDSETNLKEFLSMAHKHINDGKLSIKEYQKMIKYVLWQLCVTFYWLHHSMHCCYLDLCAENILLENADFIPSPNGLHINPNISIKLTDFGVAECFNNDTFLCEKQGLSIFNESYFAPKVFNGEIFDAKQADNWCLGMILFQCMTVGQQLYYPSNMYKEDSGYMSLNSNQLYPYLLVNNLMKYFTSDSFDLLNGLLNIDEEKRFKMIDILHHKWFKSYFKRYKNQLVKKINQQKKRLIQQQYILQQFPFYC